MFPRTKDHGLQAGGMWVRRGREDLIIIPKSRSDLLNSSLILFGEGFKKSSSRCMEDYHLKSKLESTNYRLNKKCYFSERC